METIKILLLADEADKAIYDYFEKGALDDIDLIISCGDLNRHYLEFLVTMSHAPLLYVHGNHDDGFTRFPPEGCISIEDRIYVYRGIRILGLGGSMKYRDGSYMYTESQMKRRIRRLWKELFFKRGFDILVSHSPSFGFGDMPDLPHTGFKCFNDLLYKYRPNYMVHGHVHRSYGNFKRERSHPSGTRIINAYGKYILEIGVKDDR